MTQLVCPVCGSNDSVQHIQTVISNGTQHGVSMGGGMGLTGAAAGSFGVGISSNTSVSTLAQRFSPPVVHPQEPKIIRGLLMIVLAPLIAVIITGINAHWNVIEFIWWGIICYVLYLIPTMFIGMIVTFSNIFLRKGKARQWARKASAVQNGYYCFRDDIAFNDRYWGHPENYTYSVFTSTSGNPPTNWVRLAQTDEPVR